MGCISAHTGAGLVAPSHTRTHAHTLTHSHTHTPPPPFAGAGLVAPSPRAWPSCTRSAALRGKSSRWCSCPATATRPPLMSTYTHTRAHTPLHPPTHTRTCTHTHIHTQVTMHSHTPSIQVLWRDALESPRVRKYKLTHSLTHSLTHLRSPLHSLSRTHVPSILPSIQVQGAPHEESPQRNVRSERHPDVGPAELRRE